MTEQVSVKSDKRFAWAGIAIGAVAVVVAGAYYFDIPPSADNLSGTITPAERYRAPQQVTAADVKLGDQTIAQLLQSDAVVKLIKDPEFQALASNAKALEALSALAAYPRAMEALAAHPRAFEALASNPKAYAAYASNPKAFEAMAAKAEAFKALAADAKALAALSANAKVFEVLAAKADAFQGAWPIKYSGALAAHAKALEALAARPSALDAAARASMDAMASKK